MALARVAVGIMFLFFAEYKLAGTQFAREGFSRWVSGWLQETSVGFYKPFLHWALRTLISPGTGRELLSC